MCKSTYLFPKQLLAVGVLAVLVRGEWGDPQGPPASGRQLLCAGAVNGDTCPCLVYAKLGVACSNTVKHNVFGTLCLHVLSGLQDAPDAQAASQMPPSRLPAASQLLPDAPQMPPRCLPAASQTPPRCHPDASQMPPRCFPDASQMPPRCLPDAP